MRQLKPHLSPAEIDSFIRDLGVPKLQNYASRFGGAALKHYGSQFFASFKGVTSNTMNHLLKNDGVVAGGIKGCHDGATFLSELKAIGQIISTRVNPKNSKVVYYAYKLFIKDASGAIKQPPTLKSQAQDKTVIFDLAKNTNFWKSMFSTGVDKAIRGKVFDASSGQFTIEYVGFTMVGYIRNGEVTTIYFTW